MLMELDQFISAKDLDLYLNISVWLQDLIREEREERLT